ncbi:MAG: acyl carrier protein [Spirochaetes bacterium]|nr:acyl carrier protein [Spirochaetota bacterium]
MKLPSDKKIKIKVKDIISKLARIDNNVIKDYVSLRNDLWIDSLQAVQIMAVIEKEFKIEIDGIEIFNVDNIFEVVKLVKEYLSEKEE